MSLSGDLFRQLHCPSNSPTQHFILQANHFPMSVHFGIIQSRWFILCTDAYGDVLNSILVNQA